MVARVTFLNNAEAVSIGNGKGKFVSQEFSVPTYSGVHHTWTKVNLATGIQASRD